MGCFNQSLEKDNRENDRKHDRKHEALRILLLLNRRADRGEKTGIKQVSE